MINQSPIHLHKGISAHFREQFVRPHLFHALLIIGATLFAFWPSLSGTWVFSDSAYFSGNPLLNDPHRLWKIWFQPGSQINYFPLQATIAYLQWIAWGDNPLGYRIINLLLHTTSALLIWALLSKFQLRFAWLGGLLFAIHPQQVESVAWISEIKNTLSLPPFLLSMIFYLKYDQTRHLIDYYLSLILFFIAMLCKTTMAPFPIMILIYCWWKRGSLNLRDLTDSTPFFLISIPLGILTTLTGNWFDQNHHIHNVIVPVQGLSDKLALEGLAISFYFAKWLFPFAPSIMYYQWPMTHISIWAFLPIVIWITTVGFLILHNSTWARHVILGLSFFILFISPFCGMIFTGNLHYTWVMDHFMYIPMIGLIGIFVAAFEDIFLQLPSWLQVAQAVTIGCLFAAFGIQAHLYSAVWKDNQTLFRYAISRNSNAWLAYHNLGATLSSNPATLDEAVVSFNKALAIRPDYAETHCGLGIAYLALGKYDAAVSELEYAVQLDPSSAVAENDLGVALTYTLNAPNSVITHYRKAIQLEPRFASAYYNLGLLYAVMPGHAEDSVLAYNAAIRINPTMAEAYYGLSLILTTFQERSLEALGAYKMAIGTNPLVDRQGFSCGSSKLAIQHRNLGDILVQTSSLTERAVQEYTVAIQLDSEDPIAHNSLGAVWLDQNGHLADAISEFRKAVEINPNFAQAQSNLGEALARVPGKEKEAEVHLESALHLNPKLTNALQLVNKLKKNGTNTQR